MKVETRHFSEIISVMKVDLILRDVKDADSGTFNIFNNIILSDSIIENESGKS